METKSNFITPQDIELAKKMSRLLESVDSVVMDGNTIPVKIFKTDPFNKKANAYYWPGDEDGDEHYAVVEEGMTNHLGNTLPVEISIASTVAHEVRHRLQCNNRVSLFIPGESPTKLFGVHKIFDGSIKLTFKRRPELEFDASVTEYLAMIVFNKLKIEPTAKEIATVTLLEPSTLDKYLKNLDK